MEAGQESCRVVADLGADAIQQLDSLGAARQHGERLIHAAEIELGDDGLAVLLDQESTGSRPRALP